MSTCASLRSRAADFPVNLADTIRDRPERSLSSRDKASAWILMAPAATYPA
jgi:hypothetical protein